MGWAASTLANFRVICDSKMNTQDVIEARQLKYKVEVQYYLSVAYTTTPPNQQPLRCFSALSHSALLPCGASLLRC